MKFLPGQTSGRLLSEPQAHLPGKITPEGNLVGDYQVLIRALICLVHKHGEHIKPGIHKLSISQIDAVDSINDGDILEFAFDFATNALVLHTRNSR